MNTKTRAEKIVEDLVDWDQECWAHGSITNTIEFIASQLDSAVQEALDRPALDQLANSIRYKQRIYSDGFAAARDKAAEIAEKGPEPGGIVRVVGDVRDVSVVVKGWQKWIAECIRAMEADKC
jgi:hypothetical protein